MTTWILGLAAADCRGRRSNAEFCQLLITPCSASDAIAGRARFGHEIQVRVAMGISVGVALWQFSYSERRTADIMSRVVGGTLGSCVHDGRDLRQDIYDHACTPPTNTHELVGFG
jgi:hypothetical protein